MSDQPPSTWRDGPSEKVPDPSAVGPNDVLESADARALDPRKAEPGAISQLLEKLASAPEVPWQVPRIGDALGERYELLREIGHGGFGVVYEARDSRIGRLVAVKTIRPGTRAREKLRQEWLRREVEATAQFSHPNVVTLYDMGEGEYGVYLVMERLHGETLQARLDRGPLPLPEAIRVATEVARAVANAHANGVLHRDLKPLNVFLTEQGEVKVLDFGLAHVFGTSGLAGGGTPAYMAPEQHRGDEEDARTDVFALGVMLFEMLTGQVPYRVSRDRTTALEPGPPPTLPLPGAPPALAALVESAICKDAAGRPRDGRAVLDALREVDRALEPGSGGRTLRDLTRRVGISIAIIMLAVVAALEWPIVRSRWLGLPGRPIRVVVADFSNQTDDRDLDGLSGLLSTSLEQSRRLVVVTRTRMLEILDQLGMNEMTRIDERLGRLVAREARAQILLVPSIQSFGSRYSLDLKGVDLDAADDVYPFAFKAEGTGKSGIPEMIDRVSARARQDLREREADIRASEVRVAIAITSSLDAYRHYASSQTCMNRPAYGEPCADELETALRIDPTFALAHYQLACWLAQHGGTRARQQAEIDEALRFIDRVPPREKALIRAWKEHFEGRDDKALEIYDRMIREYPGEAQPLWEAGDLLQHRSEFARAAQYIERLLRDSNYGWALDHWVDDLGAMRRTTELRQNAERWSAAPASLSTLHALSMAWGWLEDYAAAAASAKREAEAGGLLSAQQDLAYVAILSSDFAGLQTEFENAVAAGAADPNFTYFVLAALDAYQGRRRSGLGRFATLLRLRGKNAADPIFHSFRADYLVGDGDAAAVWKEVRRLLALDSTAASAHAVSLAYLGDLDRAAQVAAHLRAGTPRQQTYEALVQWHKGDRAGALQRLREIAASAPFDVDRGIAPAYLHGALAAQAGNHAEAAEALRGFQRLRIPTMMWRSWAYPRSLYLMADSLEHMGRHKEALEQVDALLAHWKHADPKEPLLKDALVLRQRLLREDSPKPTHPGWTP